MYMDLTHDRTAHVLLCLIIEAGLRQRLVAFRQDSPLEPV
jgi:hypothetical protein